MLDSTIQGFLNDRKEAWLKKKINSNSSDEDKAELELQALHEFSLATWLPDAAKRAKQLFMISHPGKFSHPSAKISSIIASCAKQRDGFLRTGNVEADLDIFGNAAAMDVHKFLSLKLADGESILTHLGNKTAEIEKQLTVSTASFAEIEQGLLAIMDGDGLSTKTSARVKQVYFPVAESYHLLSTLTPSNIMYSLKERINIMRFSDEAKEAREAKKGKKHHEQGLSEIYGLSVIGFGGTKPQNISVLNSKNGGAAYLLSSSPPTLNTQTIQPPRTNFFSNTLWAKAYQEDFKKLHTLLMGDGNNIHIRNKRNWLTRNIIYQVVDRVWMVRYLEAGWSEAERFKDLPQDQKIWLDQFYKQSRDENDDWLDAIKKDFALWFLHTYEIVNGKKEIMLGDDQLPYFKQMMNDCEEALR